MVLYWRLVIRVKAHTHQVIPDVNGFFKQQLQKDNYLLSGISLIVHILLHLGLRQFRAYRNSQLQLVHSYQYCSIVDAAAL